MSEESIQGMVGEIGAGLRFERRIIQISTIGEGSFNIFALCNDGTLWAKSVLNMEDTAHWVQVNGVPQPEPVDPKNFDQGEDFIPY